MRYVLTFAGLLLVVGALVFVKFSQISSLMALGKQMQKSGPPPESVGTFVAREQAWEGSLSAVGSVTTVKGVAISNDAPGVVTRIRFESGAVVKSGDVLVELDSSVERAQVASAQVRKELALVNVKRSRALRTEGVVAQSQLDADESQLKSATADIDLLQAQIARKIVRAPFAGRLGIRNVNLGQYLNPGTPLTVLEDVDAVYVDFTLPQQQQAIKVGMPVHITVEGAALISADGTIAAIDPTVDASTRSMKLRATVPNKDGKLRPGMFANVAVILPESAPVVTVPATSVVHAPYGDSIFTLDAAEGDVAAPGPDGKPVKIARQHFVKVGEERGDFIAVNEGIKAGEEVVSAGAFKLRNGARVTIDNTVANKPELHPHPENR